jgi:RNA polymerase sigma factor (sigma-70 family)
MQSKCPNPSFPDTLEKNAPLIRYLAGKLKNKCYKYGHNISMEDSIHHVQLAAWMAWKEQHKHSVEGISPYSFGAYLNTFVKYIFRRYLKKEIGKPIINLDDLGWMSDTMQDSSEIEDYDIKDLLDNKLAELDEREQLVIKKRYYESKTLQDVASELKLSVQTISNIQKSAEGKLYSKIKHLYNE